VLKSVDRQDLIELLANRTDMTRQEAARTVDEWEQLYRQTRSELQQTWQDVQRQAGETAEVAADVGADVAWWSFAALMVGALSALAGGVVGAKTGGDRAYRQRVVL
jgi:hypothetical protein